MPLSTLAAIIERDSKSTTYKFALLRATIDAAVENSLRVVKHPNPTDYSVICAIKTYFSSTA